jgi:AcrR family transcriptional regulator
VTSPSDAPVRTTGTRTRSGNALLRTRGAILDAAAECIARDGVRKTTMSDVSTQARVAKATLYNHFRTKDDLLAALLLARVEQLSAECAELAVAGLAPALEYAGRSLAASAPLRQVASTEPAVAAALATPATGRTWEAVRSGVATVLREAGAPSDDTAVDVVLRWLCGQVMWAATEAELAVGARVLADGLGRAADVVALRAEVPALPDPQPSAPGVGWPG